MRWKHLLVLGLLPLSSCGSNPSEDQGKVALQAYLQDAMKGTDFDLTAFGKTNGQTVDVAGVKAYRLFYRANLRFPRGYRPECVPQGNRFMGFDCGLAQSAQRIPIAPQPAGSAIIVSGQIGFESTEKGWIPNAVLISDVRNGANAAVAGPREEDAVSDPGRIASAAPQIGPGYFFIFETSSAPSRREAEAVVSGWQGVLSDSGVQSYEIRYDEPRRIRLCVWNNTNPVGVRKALMAAQMNPGDLRLIADLNFNGTCASSAERPG